MKVLVLGSGQLAQMMYLAAAPLGVDVKAIDVSNNNVVNPINKEAFNHDLAVAMEDADAITVEFEHIPESLLDLVHQTGKLHPNIRSILAGGDRVREKKLLESQNIPNCDHLIITSHEQLENVISELGERVIFKSSRDGYDGYGQWRMTKAVDLDELRAVFAGLDLNKVPLIAEKMVDFEREISVIGARDKSGNVRIYDIAENLHYQGQLHVSIAPATNLNEHIVNKAHSIFTKISQALDYVGVLAVELFQTNDNLLVNEIAPRVHNSGHWTQDGCETCQFEQHIRAVLDFPLGSTATYSVTAMVNIIGCTRFSRDLIAIEGCNLHWYGKTLREKRKMGHINVVADSYEALSEKLELLMESLPSDYFPMVPGEIKRLKHLNS